MRVGSLQAALRLRAEAASSEQQLIEAYTSVGSAGTELAAEVERSAALRRAVVAERWWRLREGLRTKPMLRGLLRALMNTRASALSILEETEETAAAQQHELNESVALERWKLAQVPQTTGSTRDSTRATCASFWVDGLPWGRSLELAAVRLTRAPQQHPHHAHIPKRRRVRVRVRLRCKSRRRRC